MREEYQNISSPIVINCKEYYNNERELVKQHIHDNDLKNKYYLAVIQVGEEKESGAYINGKKKDFEYVGSKVEVEYIDSKEPGYINKVCSAIGKYNQEPCCAGLMIEVDRKLLKGPGVKEVWQGIYNLINPKIDIDGLTDHSFYIPNTALGTINLLENYMEVDLRGKVVTVIGRSKLVGKPIIDLLIKRGSTVICCNSNTPKYQISNYIANSDIIISATGNPGMITYEDFNRNQKYIVIDIGTSYIDGKLVGDLAPSVYECHYPRTILYTSVPGGMGLVTRATVLTHFLFGIEYREKMFKNYKQASDYLQDFILIPKNK